MGMNLMAAAALLPITILTDSFFSPSFPPQNVDYAVIGLGLITVRLYHVCCLLRFLGLSFQSGWICCNLNRRVLGNVDFWREAVVWIWLSLCAMIVGLALVTLKERITQDASIKSELTYQAALALLDNQI